MWVLWRSLRVLVAVQVWVSQLLVLGWGVVGWVLLGVGARHSWLRAWWHLFATCAGVFGDADGGGAVGVTRCRGHDGGGRHVVGDVVGGVGGGVDSAVGVGGAGVADGEGVIGDTW